MEHADGIAQWLRWGDRGSRAVRTGDIGRWRVGGKAACGYLADRVELYAKAAGRAEVWYFHDEEWATRSRAADWGEPQPLPRDVPLPPSLARTQKEDGYVRIEMSRLRSRVYNIEDLRWHLANTYRVLLERGNIEITINGAPVSPLSLPRSSAFDDVTIDLRTESGRRVRGWVGRLNRDAVMGPSARRRIEGGIRCLYQGRLIGRPYYFGHAGDAKGSLASLIGEVELGSMKPNIMKTDYDRSTQEWNEIEVTLHELLSPIVREFREAVEKKVVTRQERKALGVVCDELEEVFRRLREGRSWSDSPTSTGPAERGDLKADSPVLGYGGRERGQRSMGRDRREPVGGQDKRDREPRLTRVSSSEDQIGRMIRLINKVSGGGLKPPAILDAFDPTQRSGWRTEGGRSMIVVNTAFPLYEAFHGSAPYLAETVVMELARPQEGEQRDLADYIAHVNVVTATWVRVRQWSAASAVANFSRPKA